MSLSRCMRMSERRTKTLFCRVSFLRQWLAFLSTLVRTIVSLETEIRLNSDKLGQIKNIGMTVKDSDSDEN